MLAGASQSGQPSEIVNCEDAAAPQLSYPSVGPYVFTQPRAGPCPMRSIEIDSEADIARS
jgi:hypothetical protein